MKKRHFPNKPQNNWGGDYQCVAYSIIKGVESCHQLDDWADWMEDVKWDQKDINGKLICKGNRHNCGKLRFKLLASIK